MTTDQPTAPIKRLWHTAREYLTHWAAAGVIVALTGFTPDHWIAHLFHYLNLDTVFDKLPVIDFRLLAVSLGVAVVVGDILIRNHRIASQRPASAPVAAGGPAYSENLDSISRKPSIAVLPFVNMSDDKSKEYFADGMTEDIINGLSCDNRLFVIARNSTFAYKGQSPDIRAVGKELGVRYVLEGSIRPINDRLRISVQLIETDSGTHVWGDKIDRPASEIFAVMDEVVDGLVTALSSNLGVAESQRAKRVRPENQQAWALCVQAEVLYITQADLISSREAERLVRRATEIEPTYAVGWALLACMLGRRIVLGQSGNLANDSAEIMALVSKALRLAPNDPVVLGYSGYAAIWAGHASEAVDYLQRSLAINPNNSFSLFAHGAALWMDARHEEGLAQLKLFTSHSPKDPYIGFGYFFLSCCYLSLNNPQQAEQAVRSTVKHASSFAWGYVVLAMCLAAVGRVEEAAQQIQKVRQLESGFTHNFVEGFWRHVMRNEQAEKWIAILRQAWPD
jgi:adenylate cyclase